MTKIIKINYPSKDSDTVGQISAMLRETTLDYFESNQISFSFSNNKQSGYIMVYPTPPILSIRVSNHETDGSKPNKKAVIQEGRKTVINAEADDGQEVAEELVVKALTDMRSKGLDIKTILVRNGLI